MSNGDHPLEPFEEQLECIEDSPSTKEIRKIHGLVQGVTAQPLHLLSSSSRICPDFVQLLSNEDLGMIDFLWPLPLILRCNFSNKSCFKSFGGH